MSYIINLIASNLELLIVKQSVNFMNPHKRCFDLSWACSYDCL